MKRRKWVLWVLLAVGPVFGNCQVIPESHSPETLITTPIPTSALPPTTTSILQAPTITPVPTLAPTPTTTSTIKPKKLETLTSPTAVPGATGVEPEMLLAKVTVEAVELRQLESLPIQIQLFIKGILPDECEYELVATQAREGQMISVTLKGQRPADLPCITAIQPVTYTLRLEGGFEPGDYNLVVNDYQTSFSVGE